MKLLIATAALLIGSSAASAASTNDQSSLRGKGATARSTIYCFDVERTGSRFVKRVCQTEAEWNAEGIEVPEWVSRRAAQRAIPGPDPRAL